MMDIAKSRDPLMAMEKISPHLRDNGGIRKSSLKYLVELMKSIKNKLIPKCLVVNIIKASDETVQFRLFRQGAWDILFHWLTDAQTDENHSFILELLTFYLSVPVTMELLTLNRCPKVIKQLSKSCESGVSDIAAKIVKKWRRTVELQSSQSADITEAKKRKLESDPKEDHKDIDLIKKRPTTVKIPPTHMRTAGLEDESTHAVKSRSEILSKKGMTEVKSPSHDKPVKETISCDHSPDVNLESMHQKIKVQTEKRRSSKEIHESSGFIDALTSFSQPALRKKKKSSMKTDAPPSKIPKKDDASNQHSQSSVHVKSDDNILNSSKDELSDSRNDEMGPKKSSLLDLASSVDINKKQKKRVSWATPDDLISIQYFELDETERINVNRISVEEMAKKEHLAESQLFTNGKRMSDELPADSNGLLKWKTPQALEGVPALEHCGMNSKERKIQNERESRVLQAIYFSKESIPPSPCEPDTESYEHLEPKVIPLEDVTTPLPETPVETNPEAAKNSKSLHEELLIFQQEGDAKMSLNPQIADLVKSLAENYSSTDNSKPDVSNNGFHSTVPTTLTGTNERSLASVINSSSSKNPKNHFFSTEGQNGSLSGDDKMRAELMQLIQLNYPEINISELTVERVRELLEPLKEQLISRNIFPLPPHNYSSLPPPPFQSFGVPYKSGLPNGNVWGGPHGPIRGPVRGQMPALGPRGLPRQPICQYFMQGSCNKGAACAFMHPAVPPQNHGHRPPRQMMHRPPFAPGNSGRGRMPRPPSQGFRQHHNYT